MCRCPRAEGLSFEAIQACLAAESIPYSEASQRHGDVMIVAPGWAHLVVNEEVRDGGVVLLNCASCRLGYVCMWRCVCCCSWERVVMAPFLQHRCGAATVERVLVRFSYVT